MIDRELHERVSTVTAGRAQWRCLFTLLIIMATFAAAPAQEKKLTPEELIARHVESLGSAEAQTAARSRAVSGKVTLTFRVGGTGNLPGDALLISSDSRVRLSMRFPTIEYPREDLAFDGDRAATGYLPKGIRSQLSAFLSQQDAPLKEGLLGGVLSTAWPLLRIEQQQPRWEYRGLKKVDGRELHEMNYRPRKGSSGLKTVLQFDAQTSRHVRTQYSFQIGAQIGTKQDANSRPESTYSLTEEFDDFRSVDGMMLPHKYRLQLNVRSGTGTLALYDYTLAVSSISHKETFDEKAFTIK